MKNPISPIWKPAAIFPDIAIFMASPGKWQGIPAVFDDKGQPGPGPVPGGNWPGNNG